MSRNPIFLVELRIWNEMNQLFNIQIDSFRLLSSLFLFLFCHHQGLAVVSRSPWPLPCLPKIELYLIGAIQGPVCMARDLVLVSYSSSHQGMMPQDGMFPYRPTSTRAERRQHCGVAYLWRWSYDAIHQTSPNFWLGRRVIVPWGGLFEKIEM